VTVVEIAHRLHALTVQIQSVDDEMSRITIQMPFQPNRIVTALRSYGYPVIDRR
jgi:hypothetical protein